MPKYGHSAWYFLGTQIKTARKQQGMRDTKLWADKVGRSTRVLLGLERGEPVGDDTLELVELALGWPAGRCEVILAQQPNRPDLDLAVMRQIEGSEIEDADAARGLSVVPAIVEPVAEDDSEVLAAIRQDPALDEIAREHFVNQYLILRDFSAFRRANERLPYVAHGKRTEPVDPEQERQLEELARAAAEANPDSPVHKGRGKKPRPTSPEGQT